jgi:hypothetical protein
MDKPGRARILSWSVLLWIMVGVGSAHAVVTNVSVSSSDSASWSRSDGGTGTTGTSGVTPGVWNSTFSYSIPAGSTAISFTLDSYAADDKGVVKLNGAIIADAVVFQPNGGAAGAGTFDFGQGGGSQAYTYVGFTPGVVIPLPNGTTAFTLVGYVNDTSSADPSSTPLPFVFISSFGLSGTLSFDAPLTPTPTVTATPSATNSPTATRTATVTVTPSPSGTPTQTRTNTPTSSPTTTNTATSTSTSTSTQTITNTPTISPTTTSTATRTNTPTITNTPLVQAPVGPPAIPALSTIGAAMLALLLAGLALLLLVRSRA